MPKLQAFYEPHEGLHIVIGQRAVVRVLKHPRSELSGQVCTTSAVQRVETDGVFETLNTVYIPGKIVPLNA